MPWIAGLIAGTGSLAGGLIGAGAQSSAASEETAALQQALQFDKGVYGTATSNLQPYIGTGGNAEYSLASLLGLPGRPGQPNTGQGAQAGYLNWTQTPAYQFALQQGNLGANRGLAAAGLTGSGAQAKALTQYNQGYASSGFNNYLSQLSGLAGLGEQASSSLGQIGTGIGSQVGGLYSGIGGAQAAGTIGSTNSLLGGLGGFLGGLTNSPGGFGNSALGQLFAGSGGTSYGGNGQTPQVNGVAV